MIKDEIIKISKRNPDILNFVEKYSKKAIGISTTLKKEILYSSKFGGKPYVLYDFEWPYYKGKPMSFICQINLEEVKKFDSNSLFPEKGILYFFWDTNYSFRNEEYLEYPHSIIYDDLSRFDDGYYLMKKNDSMLFKEKKINFYNYISLPEGELPDCISVSNNIDDDDLFECIEKIENKVFNRYNNKHHILGYPSSLQVAVQTEWAIQYLGVKLDETNIIENKNKINSILSDFDLLLQIDFEDVNLNFSKYASPTSRLYFGIEKNDLENKNFNKSFLSFQNY